MAVFIIWLCFSLRGVFLIPAKIKGLIVFALSGFPYAPHLHLETYKQNESGTWELIPVPRDIALMMFTGQIRHTKNRLEGSE